MLPLAPTSTLFPYTTLFRSHIGRREPVLREHRAGIREARVSQRVLRIERQRLIEALERLLEPEPARSEEHTSELQSLTNLVCRLLLEKKKNNKHSRYDHTND